MTKNRARRILKRLDQLQNAVASCDARCREIENSNKLDDAAKEKMLKAARKDAGAAQGQINALETQASDARTVLFGDQIKPLRCPVAQDIWTLPRTDFPAANTGRRQGKAARAFRTVADCR